MKPNPIVLLAPLVIGILTAPLQARSQGVAAALDEILRNAEFNGSALISHQGKTLLNKGYGFADHERGVKNKSITQHRIGSITKPFTAMAILILEVQGKLKTDATVGDYLPEFPEIWKPLTIHQLLTHTSGLIHSWRVPAFAQNGVTPRTLDETLGLFFDLPLEFKSGSEFRYSGVGYFLLAKIIEVRSAQTYAEFLQDYIFTPLGMNHTGADQPHRPMVNEATGYQISRQGNRRIAPAFYMPLLTGGGNLYTTVEDLK